MNISRILSSLGECDRASFCEAIADASHYVATALDVLPASDYFSFPELCSALDYLNSLNSEIEKWQSANESDDDDLDFSGIEKAIADEGKEMTISQMLKDQWDNEKLVGRGWH